MPDELANRDVRTESGPVTLLQGRQKPSGGVPLLLDLPSNSFPLNRDSMGSARGWIDLRSLR